jgi:hypothetical protein
MSWIPVGADEWERERRKFPKVKLPGYLTARRQLIAGVILRAVFIASLLVVTMHVAMPQSETIWTVYETPGDLIRLILGVLACIFFAVQLFSGPKDALAHRTWLFLGLAVVPFAVICIVGIW